MTVFESLTWVTIALALRNTNETSHSYKTSEENLAAPKSLKLINSPPFRAISPSRFPQSNQPTNTNKFILSTSSTKTNLYFCPTTLKNMNSDISLPNLLCEEEDYDSLKPSKPSSDDDHYIQTLIQQETLSYDYVGCFSYHNNNNDNDNDEWFKCARLDAINWIFSV